MAITCLVMQLITQNKFVDAFTSATTEWAGLGVLVTYMISL